MAVSQSKQLLIDVRTPAEFATGALANDLCSAVNIEYQRIDQLPEVYLRFGVHVDKDDDITLYCRSGRRSNIALRTLRAMGYTSARDIGGLEEAKTVLKEEEMRRVAVVEEKVANIPERVVEEKKEARVKAFGTLLDALKGLD